MRKWLRERWEAWMGYLYIQHHVKVEAMSRPEHTPCQTCQYLQASVGKSPEYWRCGYYSGDYTAGLRSNTKKETCPGYKKKTQSRGLLRILFKLIW